MRGHVPPHLYMLSWHVQGQLNLCVIYFVYFTGVRCVGFWDLESCWFWCGYVGKGLCRLVGCVVAVGEMCCGEGHTACLSSAWRKEAE